MDRWSKVYETGTEVEIDNDIVLVNQQIQVRRQSETLELVPISYFRNVEAFRSNKINKIK